MSGSEYNYDENAQFFPFFILTISGLITIPVTYNVLKPSTKLENTAPRIQSDFKPADEEIIQTQKKRQIRSERKVKRMVLMVVGYAIIAWMLYLIAVTQRTAPKIWDPYDVLGISRSADERAIDKFYKRLSLQYHPDKARPDPSKNETLETINERWVEMTKAYKALTDEEVRNNYLQYGHPDGKQSFSMGIALPKVLISEGNRKFVLLFYAALLAVILPYLVGNWWYSSISLTKDKVLMASAGNLFLEYKDDLSDGAVIGALSVGDEFKQSLKGSKADAGSAKIEKSVLADSLLSAADRTKLKGVEDPTRRKALSLLWAYLNRIDLGDPSLNAEKYEVAPIAFNLNNAMSSIAIGSGNTKPLLSSYHTSQNLIQAMPPNASPLLQLPYITSELAKKIARSQPKLPLTVQKFLALPPQLRRSLCSDLSDSQYSQAMQVATQIPHLQVAKAFFKVQGDRVITPGSLVQLVIKARFIPPGTPNVPEIDPLDLEEIDPDEDDLDGLLGRKPPKNRKRKAIDGRVIEEDESKSPSTNRTSIQPPLAHAPYFARDHSPRWHIFLADSRTGKIAVPPFTVTEFDKPIFKDNEDGSRTPTFNMQTLKFHFAAPPQVHAFPFIMHMICDSYVGFDETQPVVLDVRDVKEVVDSKPGEAEDDSDDISEPDEGTLFLYSLLRKFLYIRIPTPETFSHLNVIERRVS